MTGDTVAHKIQCFCSFASLTLHSSSYTARAVIKNTIDRTCGPGGRDTELLVHRSGSKGAVLNVNVSLKNGFVLFCFGVCPTGECRPRGDHVFAMLPAHRGQTHTYCHQVQEPQGHGHHWILRCVFMCVCVIHLQLRWLRMNDPRMNIQL